MRKKTIIIYVKSSKVVRFAVDTNGGWIEFIIVNEGSAFLNGERIMLFYPGYQERIRHFLTSNENYEEYLRANSPWTVPDIVAMQKKDDDFLATIKTVPADESEGGEIPKYYSFNQTGNIMISSTAQNEGEINPDVKLMFQKVSVFFAALTAAINKKGKTLYDYDAINDVITGSGMFINMHREDRTFTYSSTKVSLNAAIISAVLGGVAAGAGALIVAQQIVDRMGSQIEISVEKGETTKKIAHVLFVCENLMGMATVAVSLFYIEAKEGDFVLSTPCGSVTNKKINFAYHQDTNMFIDPEYIRQFTPDFAENPEFDALIDRLADQIKT